MRELTDNELDLVAGGVVTTPTPPSTGNLHTDAVRFFTDAAKGASQLTLISDLKAIQTDLAIQTEFTNNRNVVAFLI